jgi:hypothetical protein
MVDVSPFAVQASVAAQHQSAVQLERSREAEALSGAIESVKPALKSLCGRIANECTVKASTNPVQMRAEKAYFPKIRGLHLAGDPEPDESTPRDARGCGLWLLSDGALAEVYYDGQWSGWPGTSWGWQATLRQVTARAAMDGWALADCLAAIGLALVERLERAEHFHGAR